MNISDQAKTILCFGDSITWGRVPLGERYERSKRWPNILQKELGESFEVISEGLPGRTLVAHDPAKPYKTGITHLSAILRTHRPLDLVIIMLGTNDTKDIYNLTAQDIGEHLKETITVTKKENIKNILVLCPPKIVVPASGELASEFVPGLRISEELPDVYMHIAKVEEVHFLNIQKFVEPSHLDGVHLDEEGNQKLAEVLKDEVLKILNA